MGLDPEEASVRSTRSLRIIAAAGVLLASVACSNGTEPEAPLATAYVLATVDGTPAPLVIATHTWPSGVQQVYTMVFDSLTFSSPTQLRRRFLASLNTYENARMITPPLEDGSSYPGMVVRRGNRLIVEYGEAGSGIKPDTFTVRDGALVKQGPFGLACATCAPVRRVEYVYEAL